MAARGKVALPRTCVLPELAYQARNQDNRWMRPTLGGKESLGLQYNKKK